MARGRQFKGTIGYAMKTMLSLLTLLAAIALQFACGKSEGPSPESSASPVPVRSQTLHAETVAALLEVPGTVQPRNRMTLASQVNGFVRTMHVRAGDVVQSGQLLASLDARDPESQAAAAQAAVEEAQAALSEARRAHQASVETRAAAQASARLAGQTLERYEKMFASRSVSPQEIDEVRMRHTAGAAEVASRDAMVAAAQDRIRQAEARVTQATAQAQRARVLLGWTQIQAPASGRIAERLADAGTAIFPGTPLLTLETEARPQILADLPTEHARSLRPGLQVGIRAGAGTQLLQGRVTEIVPLSHPATHSVQFKVDLPAGTGLSSGQFATVLVPAETRTALLAPNTAIRVTGQLTGLFVIDETSHARFRLAKTAPYDAERTEILSGVEEGEKIISLAGNQIVDGIPVEVRQ